MSKELTKVQKKLREVFYRERKRKSLEEIKVTDLCALAEVSHSSFYKYYTDVYDFNRKQESLLYSEMVLSKIESEGVENVSRYLADFVWKNYGFYHPSEAFIFLENLYQYNLENVPDFQPTKKENIAGILPLCNAVQSLIISYVGTLFLMREKKISESDYAVIDEMWRDGIRLLRKFIPLKENEGRKFSENGTKTLLAMLAEEHEKTVLRKMEENA